MGQRIYPRKAIAVMRAAKHDPSAECMLSYMSAALVWTDENYSAFQVACLANNCRRYWDPAAYRASLVLGRPDKRYRAGWEELRRLCPRWPGFRPERRSRALRAELKRAVLEMS